MRVVTRNEWAVALLSSLVLLSGCKSDDGGPTTSLCGDLGCPEQTCDNFDPLRQPFFGDTHVHTALSFDANVRATRTTPEDAYRFARGEPLGLQPYDEEGNPTRSIQRDRPLDFVVVSDHAEYFGTVRQCRDPERPAYDHPDCDAFRGGPVSSFVVFGAQTATPPENAAYPDLCGEDAELCLETGMEVWQEIIDAANAADDSSASCELTAFIGYEWSATTDLNNLHRNVIFRNSTVPEQAIGYFDEPYVEGLWERLRADCIDADNECDALTIPHNSNMGGGAFFALSGRDGPFDSEYVAERAFMEPVIEIFQHKGDSECFPGETISDELCGFEKLPYGSYVGSTLGVPDPPSPSSFVRAAFGEGMNLEAALGTNPFKHGIIASTDTHVSAPGEVDEQDFPGHSQRGGEPDVALLPGLISDSERNPGGLAGVWAEENSREAIFLAMRRKETFGTSGPEIVVRFFGGWSYPDDMCDRPDLPKIGYERGVAMGADLPPPRSASPTFVVSAMQDLGTEEHPGTPLQRVQIVKGWVDGAGEYRVEVFEVGGNPENGASVDLDTCEPDEGSGGFSSICATWTDPSFDPSHRAYYYARVIENPTCRWSQWQCNEAGVDCNVPETVTEGFEPCCEPETPKTIQERAWTSPIWYAPE